MNRARGLRKILRRQSHQSAHGPLGEDHAEKAACRTQQKAFGEQLPNDSPACRSECSAHRDLLDSRAVSSEQQIRDIRAGDGQQHDDRCNQNQ